MAGVSMPVGVHQNHLLLVTNENASDIPSQVQTEATPTVLNATPEAFSAGVGSLGPQPSLVTRQGGGPDLTGVVEWQIPY